MCFDCMLWVSFGIYSHFVTRFSNTTVNLYISTTIIGAEYKSKFQSLESSPSEGKDSKTKLLGEVCTFVDMVPPFRDLATKSMGSMIELQKGQLYELGEFSYYRHSCMTTSISSSWFVN